LGKGRNGKIIGSFGTPGYLLDIFPVIDKSQAPIPQLRLGQEKGFQIILSAGADAGSRITMKDERNKRRTVIGNTKLKVRQTQRTYSRQVSSIVLFDELGRFLWSAPGGIKTDAGR
jgi:hypothetical protein